MKPDHACTHMHTCTHAHMHICTRTGSMIPGANGTSWPGGVNDANAVFEYNGVYHVMHQCDGGPAGAPCGGGHVGPGRGKGQSWWHTWGHLVSTDLVHWRRLPDALTPPPYGTTPRTAQQHTAPRTAHCALHPAQHTAQHTVRYDTPHNTLCTARRAPAPPLLLLQPRCWRQPPLLFSQDGCLLIPFWLINP